MFTNTFDLCLLQSHELVDPKMRMVVMSIEHNDELSLSVLAHLVDCLGKQLRDCTKILFSEFSTELTNVEDLKRFIDKKFTVIDPGDVFVRLDISERQELRLWVWSRSNDEKQYGSLILFSEFSKTVTNVDELNRFVDAKIDKYGG
jgi:hypothetical protein